MAGNKEAETGIIRETHSLMEALGLILPVQVSLVGGGGKTSLMFALAAEAAQTGYRVISTTTTRIFRPSEEQSTCVVLEMDGQKLAERVGEELESRPHVTAARALTEDGKLLGLLPATVDLLEKMKLADLIINEADGANRRPIKAPSITEPVIPDGTGLVVAVMGMDALGARLDPGTAFRPELISKVTGLVPGEIISSSAIAKLMTSSQGIIQHTPARAKIVPFINKMDRSTASAGIELAQMILRHGHPQISRVALGSLRDPQCPFVIIQQV